MRAATGAEPTADSAYYAGYRYFWWLDMDHPGRYYAMGKYGQYIYVAPDADTVVVRFGRDWGSTTSPGWRPSATSPTSSSAGPDVSQRNGYPG